METAELVKSLGEKIGIVLALEDGVASFEADGMSVSIVDIPEHEALAITGDLGALPPEHLERLYRTLLEAQHAACGTFGAMISLNPETEHFTLSKVIPLKMLDPGSFATELEQFIDTLETDANLIHGYHASIDSMPSESDAAAIPDGDLGNFLRV